MRALAQYNTLLREKHRREDDLRRKFANLYNTHVPTGTPDIPEHVRCAKDIRMEVIAKVDLGCNDVGDLDIDDVDDDRANVHETPKSLGGRSVGEGSAGSTAYNTRNGQRVNC